MQIHSPKLNKDNLLNYIYLFPYRQNRKNFNIKITLPEGSREDSCGPADQAHQAGSAADHLRSSAVAPGSQAG